MVLYAVDNRYIGSSDVPDRGSKGDETANHWIDGTPLTSSRAEWRQFSLHP
jgi:hypothetical protein